MRVLHWMGLEAAPPAGRGRWRYGLLVEDIEADGFHCESYGVVVTDAADGQEAVCRHVSVNAGEVTRLLELLARNGVTPATLRDVVEDWLGR